MFKAHATSRGRQLLKSFRKDERGNFAMLLGLSIVPLITFMGCAVDYSRVTSIKASLNSAADAAALNAVTRAINGAAAVPVVAPPSTTQIRAYFNGASNDSQYVGPEDYDSTSTSIPADASFTYNIFYTGPTGTCPTQLAETSPAPAAFGATGATQYASLPDNLKVQSFARGTQSGPNFAAAKIDYNTPTGSVATPCTPNSYIATVSYSAPIPTSILQVVGIKQVMIHGTATAQSKLPSYLNFYMLMDNSPSMGIGGSATDIANLEALTSKWDSNGGCAFACHERNPDGTDDPNDYYHVALNNGVKTRIDYLRDAVASLLGVAQTTQQVPNQFQFGLYTFSNTTTQTVVSPLSSNYTTLLSDTQNIKLGYNSVNNPKMNMYGDVNAGPDEETDIDAAMKFAGAQVATAYTTPRPPVNFVVLVSDGVQDKVDCNTTGTTSGGCRAYEPISLSTCNALKAAGDQVAVVYTPYLPITNNSWYNSYVAPINVQPVPASASLPQVTNVMKSCASDPSLFAETGPNTDIGTALKNIFENALARTLLTN